MTQKMRILAAVVAIGLGLITRGTIFYEVQVVVNENCSNLAHLSADRSELALNYWYQTVWMFYMRNITTKFLPFIVLAYMNISIVYKRRSLSYDLEKMSRSAAKNVTEQKRKSNQRATRMMLLVVTTYLITNVPAVVVTAWEHIDKSSLVKKRKFYTLIADVISLLTVVASASRLPGYIWCNAQIRKELKQLMCRAGAGGELENRYRARRMCGRNLLLERQSKFKEASRFTMTSSEMFELENITPVSAPSPLGMCQNCS